MNIKSSYRLFDEDWKDPGNDPFRLLWGICYGACYEMFFDKGGNRLPSINLDWGRNGGVYYFPDNLDHAYRLTQLLVDKAQGEDPQKYFDLTPATEIQKQLIEMFWRGRIGLDASRSWPETFITVLCSRREFICHTAAAVNERGATTRWGAEDRPPTNAGESRMLQLLQGRRDTKARSTANSSRGIESAIS